MSIKALRLYHEKMFLVPVVDSDSGYRYYREKHIAKAKAIVLLKELTFSISDISTLLEDFDDDVDAVAAFIAKRLELQKKIAELKIATKFLDEIISREEAAMTIGRNNTFTIERITVDQILVAAKRWRGRYEDCDAVFSKLYKAFGFRVSGRPFNLYYDEGCMEGDADIETCVPIRKGERTAEFDVKQINSTSALSLVHQGSYQTIGSSYQKIFDYMNQNNIKAKLPYREIYVKGPGMIFKGNPGKYLTEIQIGIQ